MPQKVLIFSILINHAIMSADCFKCLNLQYSPSQYHQFILWVLMTTLLHHTWSSTLDFIVSPPPSLQLFNVPLALPLKVVCFTFTFFAITLTVLGHVLPHVLGLTGSDVTVEWSCFWILLMKFRSAVHIRTADLNFW